MTPKSKLEIVAFPSAKAWEHWLARNHVRTSGVWLRFFKKESGVASISHAEALAAALCYGWIDGQLKKGGRNSWLRKFTPRRSRAFWSKRNRELVEQLAKAGKMRPAGLKEAAAAKADGRWSRAYESPSKMTVPKDFLQELSKHKKARKFFDSLTKANTYAIAWRLRTAKKPETRDKRGQAIIDMLVNGEKFHD